MNSSPRRNFSVGSEWLYFKLYTGHQTADLVLTEIIKPITDKLIAEGTLEQWFFIRYADPEHHIRVRFRSLDPQNLGKIITSLHQPLDHFMQQDLIWKIQLDTYQRELERYGKNTMELSETLFYYDSDSTVQFLDLIEGDEGERLRWLYGLRSIDHLLDSFGYILNKKLDLMEHLKIGFGEEFGMSRFLKKQLDEKYRRERKNIENFMVFTAEKEPDYKPILTILNTKRKLLEPIAEQILYFSKEGLLEIGLDNLLSSYIHMLNNRLFKSKNRLNEMVCYDYLHRFYRTKLAMQKKY